MAPAITLRPIGVIRSPFREKVEAPRQATVASDTAGTIELEPGRNLEHALCDLDAWDHIWVLFWFDRVEGWRPKVQPPRSRRRRGVLATRSPHRPNPIGLSVVRLEAVNGLTLHVRGIDMLDGTPVLDIKPYVPYADAVAGARAGWLPEAEDPLPAYEVAWSELAREQAAFIAEASGFDLAARANATLALGPEPHPYRRIRAQGDGMVLAVKDWRVRFRLDGRRVLVERIASGYRQRELSAATPEAALHREVLARFGG